MLPIQVVELPQELEGQNENKAWRLRMRGGEWGEEPCSLETELLQRLFAEHHELDVTLQPEEPIILRAITAQLPVVPAPLRLLHGPLLVTVETWSDGLVVARLPAAALYGEGANDTMAMTALGEAIVEFAREVEGILRQGKLGGGLERQWRALTALIDISGLESSKLEAQTLK